LNGSADDADRDGLPNLVEFVLGSKPDGTAPDAHFRPTAERVHLDPDGSGPIAEGSYLRFTHRRSHDSMAAGVTAACEFATDPNGSWLDASLAPGVVIVVRAPADGMEPLDIVDTYLPIELAREGKLFARLKASLP
jgi:hypothetical protein